MKAPVADMSLVSTKRNLFLLDAMASSLTASLVEYLLYRRFSFTNNSLFVWSYDKFLINIEYVVMYAKSMQIQTVKSDLAKILKILIGCNNNGGKQPFFIT